MKTTLKAGTLVVAVIFAVSLASCIDSESEEDNVLFFSIYNSDGTIGSSGMSSSEWEYILLNRLSSGCTIALSSDMTTEDLKTFVSALNAMGISGVKLDLSQMTITTIPEETFYGSQTTLVA